MHTSPRKHYKYQYWIHLENPKNMPRMYFWHLRCVGGSKCFDTSLPTKTVLKHNVGRVRWFRNRIFSMAGEEKRRSQPASPYLCRRPTTCEFRPPPPPSQLEVKSRSVRFTTISTFFPIVWKSWEYEVVLDGSCR